MMRKLRMMRKKKLRRMKMRKRTMRMTKKTKRRAPPQFTIWSHSRAASSSAYQMRSPA